MRALVGNRVLMLLENSYYPNDPRVTGEARALVAAGYKVSLICPARASQPRREVRDGVHLYRFREAPHGHGLRGYLWEYGYSLVMMFLTSLVVLVREGFDVVHTANPPDVLVLIAGFYKLLGKRFVYDHHDIAAEMYDAQSLGKGNRLVHRALVMFEKLSCRLADHVIATNESYKAMEMQRGGVPEERITIVRNGPNLERIRAVEPDPELRKKAGTIIGFVGVMGQQDGVDYLLRALRHLAHDLGRTDFYCVLIGKGHAWESLKALATELGLGDHVWFTGFAPDADMLRYMSSADICVDPDPSNPFTDRSTMIKMMEYMALGKPIVAFDLPEHRYTAREASLYARPNDELEFAKAIAQLMDDPARRQAMGEYGRRRIERELAWKYSVPHLLDAYRKLGASPGIGDRGHGAEGSKQKAVSSTPAGPHGSHQQQINAHFKAEANYWKELYEMQSLTGVIHQQRRSMALGWVDQLGLAPGSRILDIGCGAGLLAIELRRRGYVVDSIDASEAMVDLARTQVAAAGVGDKVTVSVGDAHALGLASGSYDLVIALGVVPFLHSPSVALAEIARVVKRGGHVIFTSDNRFRLNHVIDPWFTPALAPAKRAARRVATKLGIYDGKRSVPVQRFSYTTLERLLSNAGFGVTRSAILGFGPFSVLGLRLLPEALAMRVHQRLQGLADRGTPVLRSTGNQHIVLATLSSAEYPVPSTESPRPDSVLDTRYSALPRRGTDRAPVERVA